MTMMMGSLIKASRRWSFLSIMMCSLRLSLIALAIIGAHGFQSVYPNYRIARSTPRLAKPHSSFRTNSNIRQPFLLSSTSDDSSEEQKEDESKNNNNNNNKVLTLVEEYQVSSLAYTTTVIFMILRHGPFNIDVLYSATGPFMGAATTFLLSGAAANDRLSSDTYKRLNTLAFEYAVLCSGIVVSLVVRWLLTRQFPTFSYALFGLANILTLGPTFRGWKSGAGIEETKDKKEILKALLEELKEGNKNVWKGLRKFENYNALVYLIGTIFFGLAKLLKLSEVLVMMIRHRASTVVIGSRVARFAKLSVLVGLLYTLKDAADRNRLEGSTFVTLNFVVSAVFASMAFYWYEGILNSAIYMAAFFSIFTGANGAVAVLKKKAKEAEETS